MFVIKYVNFYQKPGSSLFVCVEVLRPSQTNGVMAQSTQWGHVERGQFTLPHVYLAGLVL